MRQRAEAEAEVEAAQVAAGEARTAAQAAQTAAHESERKRRQAESKLVCSDLGTGVGHCLPWAGGQPHVGWQQDQATDAATLQTCTALGGPELADSRLCGCLLSLPQGGSLCLQATANWHRRANCFCLPVVCQGCVVSSGFKWQTSVSAHAAPPRTPQADTSGRLVKAEEERQFLRQLNDTLLANQRDFQVRWQHPPGAGGSLQTAYSSVAQGFFISLLVEEAGTAGRAALLGWAQGMRPGEGGAASLRQAPTSISALARHPGQLCCRSAQPSVEGHPRLGMFTRPAFAGMCRRGSRPRRRRFSARWRRKTRRYATSKSRWAAAARTVRSPTRMHRPAAAPGATRLRAVVHAAPMLACCWPRRWSFRTSIRPPHGPPRCEISWCFWRRGRRSSRRGQRASSRAPPYCPCPRRRRPSSAAAGAGRSAKPCIYARRCVPQKTAGKTLADMQAI